MVCSHTLVLDTAHVAKGLRHLRVGFTITLHDIMGASSHRPSVAHKCKHV